MSYNNLIQDGTGQGYLARVDNQKRLRVKAVGRTEYDSQAIAGEAFNINTELLSVGVNTESPLLVLTNNGSRDVVLQGWFIGTDLGTVGANLGLMRTYLNVTGFSGGSAVPIVNRKSGDAFSFSINALSSPTWTPSGTPVLYQTQNLGQRVFGNVFLILPAGQSCAVTAEFSTATTPYDIYTGFTGYLADAADG